MLIIKGLLPRGSNTSSLTSPSMQPEDVDGMRRSLAIGGSLTRDDTERLLDSCQALLEQRAAIAAVLGQLGPSWREARSALNELARIVGGGMAGRS
jgi:hypothetical protein